MEEKFWDNLELDDGSRVRFIPSAPNGDQLGGVTQAERQSIGQLKDGFRELKGDISQLTTGDAVMGNSLSIKRKDDTTVGKYSVAIGYNNEASKSNGAAFGSTNTASGEAAFCAGGQGNTASGNQAHAEGRETTASGYRSHAEGYRTQATQTQAHAEGTDTVASGSNSHAEGEGCIASGSRAHAEGWGCQAKGPASHAEGSHTIAAYAQHVEGKYNVEDTAQKYVHIVGWGTESVPKNIHTLDTVGNGEYAGDVVADMAGERVSLKAFAQIVKMLIMTDGKVPLHDDSGNLLTDADGNVLTANLTGSSIDVSDTDSAKVSDRIGCVDYDLLWENNLYGGFDAQTVALDLTGYSSVCVSFWHSGNTTSRVTGDTKWAIVGNETQTRAECKRNASQPSAFRMFSADENGVTFTGGFVAESVDYVETGKWTVNAGYCIPYRIYGVRGRINDKRVRV